MELCDKWIRASPRKDYKPSEHSKLCSLHFKPSDFVVERRDSNAQRRKSLDDKPLVRRRLKEGVVPSIFPNAPQYPSTINNTPRSTSKATPTSRRQQAAQELERLEKSLIAEDDISELTTAELKSRLRLRRRRHKASQ